MWVGGGATDQEYWSDFATTHELGHWRMASYAINPGEQGPHYFGIKTFPGQAHSEGWATFHSAALRDNPIGFDIQGGTAFWVDISQRDPTTAVCSTSLCYGCRQSNGLCSQARGVCGTGGSPCAVCEANQTCVNGTCR